jgi:uncharacterized RDD family membrane protein YckC
MNDQSFVFAGFWRRFAAYMLDWVLVMLALQFVNPYFVKQLQALPFLDGFTAQRIAAVAEMWVAVLVIWSYYAGMESSPLRGTLGKLSIGLYVADETGQRISFGRATGRHVAKGLSGVILAIGFLMSGWTARKQALHDMISGCMVLRR